MGDVVTHADDSATLAAINRVAVDVQALRVDLTSRMEHLVTRREHDAEIRRVDAEARHTLAALMTHETSSDARLGAIQQDIESGEQRRLEAQAAQVERRRQDRRYIATWVVAAVSATATVTSVASVIFGH